MTGHLFGKRRGATLQTFPFLTSSTFYIFSLHFLGPLFGPVATSKLKKFYCFLFCLHLSMTFWLANQTPSHVAKDGKARPSNHVFGNSKLEYIAMTLALFIMPTDMMNTTMSYRTTCILSLRSFMSRN